MTEMNPTTHSKAGFFLAPTPLRAAATQPAVPEGQTVSASSDEAYFALTVE